MPKITYRAIRSRRKFVKAPEVKKMLGAVLNSEVKPHFIQRFEFVVANWEHKPEFKAKKQITTDAITVFVYPTGEHAKIWRYVTEGTKPHLIPKQPKTVGTLAFMWGGKGSYKPKTAPPGKFGGPGTVSGGRMWFPKQVKHPGSEARGFEKVIAKDEKPWFSRTMENAWRRIIRTL